MTARDLINYMIPHLKPEDTILQAKDWMQEFKLPELPVASEGQFLGFIDEDSSIKNPGQDLLRNTALKGISCFINEHSHYYEVLSKAYNLGFRLVAVLDDEEKYLGAVSIEDVVEAFAQASSISSPGAILVLNVDEKDYSLSNIARMIEMNDARILSMHAGRNPQDGDGFRMTLKLDVEEISQIKSVLDNNNVRVEATFNTSVLSFDEQERLDLLLRYLKP